MQHCNRNLPSPGWSLCSIMPKWQISTYVSANPSNWCFFYLNICPRRTRNLTASPHAPAGVAISKPASWNGHFCSNARCWRHERGYQGSGATRLDDLDSVAAPSEKNRAQDVNVILCLCSRLQGQWDGWARTSHGSRSWRFPHVQAWLGPLWSSESKQAIPRITAQWIILCCRWI